MSIAMSLHHVKTTKQVQPPSLSDDEEDVTEEFSFKRSVTHEKVGDNRVAHYLKSWEKKEKKANDASRSSAARARPLALLPALQPAAMMDIDKVEQLMQQVMSYTGFEPLESEWRFKKEEWLLPNGKDLAKKKEKEIEEETGNWTVTSSKKSIEYSRG